jgi:tetratricopeptide (TPR) repeat protein
MDNTEIRRRKAKGEKLESKIINYRSNFRIEDEKFCKLNSGLFTSASRLFITLFPVLFLLTSCETDLIQRQEQQLRKLRAEIKRQRDEIEDLRLSKLKMEQKRQNCNRAFRDFEMAQSRKGNEEAIALYRKGLRLCPDDDVAHYELGKLLAGGGRAKEAQTEFESAVKINPDFQAPRRELEILRGIR